MTNIWKIIKIAKPLYKLLMVIAVLIVFSALLDLVTPFFSKLIVDVITSKISGQEATLDRLYFLIALAFLLNFLGVIVTAVTERLGDHLAGNLRRYLTEQFYEKVLTLPQSYFDSEISLISIH